MDGLYYFDVTLDENYKKKLYDWFESEEFSKKLFSVKNASGKTSDKSRKVAQFGYSYDYQKKKSEKIEDIPEIVRELRTYIKKTWKDCPSDIEMKMNQCIINVYEAGQGISAHIDDTKLFGDTIVCFTFGETGRTMEFLNKGKIIEKIYTKPNSMYVMTNDFRYKYPHQMSKRKTDSEGKRGKIISITFRQVLLKEYTPSNVSSARSILYDYFRSNGINNRTIDYAYIYYNYNIYRNGLNNLKEELNFAMVDKLDYLRISRYPKNEYFVSFSLSELEKLSPDINIAALLFIERSIVYFLAIIWKYDVTNTELINCVYEYIYGTKYKDVIIKFKDIHLHQNHATDTFLF